MVKTMNEKEKLVRQIYKELTLELIEKKITVSTMESCTSGLLASLITDTEGSSAVYKGGYCSYSNEAKILFGVSSKVIEKYGVYSKETAVEMARTCKKNLGSDIGIGITGSFGNVDPANSDSVPGSVDFAISIGYGVCASKAAEKDSKSEETVTTGHISLPDGIDRFESKLFVAEAVATALKRLL